MKKNLFWTLLVSVFFVTLFRTNAFDQRPDLTITNLKVNNAEFVEFTITNSGSEITSQNGYVYLTLNNKLIWTYNWRYLKDHGFFKQGGATKIISPLARTLGEVKVCADARHQVDEINENNNCSVLGRTTALSVPKIVSELPDLAMLNVKLDERNGNLVVVYGNIGFLDSTSHNGSVNIYIDNDLKSSYNFSNLNRTFLTVNGKGILNPLKLKRPSKVTACIVPRGNEAEISESNNCITKFLEPSNSIILPTPTSSKSRPIALINYDQSIKTFNAGKPDYVISDMKRISEKEIEISMTNKGVKDVFSQNAKISIFLDNSLKRKISVRLLPDRRFIDHNGTTKFVIPFAVSNRSLKACADSDDDVHESNEANNCIVTTL